MAENAIGGSLLDELRADQGKPRQCAMCRYLTSLSDKERAEWESALGDRSFTHASIHRALLRREAGVARGSIENHRANGHKL